MELFTRADEAGHWRASFMLGVAYSEGKGVAPDCHRAAALLRRFVEEKSLWNDHMTVAARALDDGGCDFI